MLRGISRLMTIAAEVFFVHHNPVFYLEKRMASQAEGKDYPESVTAGQLLLQKDKALYEERAAANIENFIGTVRVPVGLAGPVTVHGEHAQGVFHIPMATTEGTLVASTSRGMKVMNESGGVQVRVVRNGGVQRSPVFEFFNIEQARQFATELNADWGWLAPVMEATTSHGKLMDIRCWQMGKIVTVRMTMDSGDASGQNMVSISSQKAAQALAEKFPYMKRFLMAGGMSGEKVPANVNMLLGRGKGVTASVSISYDVMKKITRADIADIPRLHQNYSNYAMWGGNRNSHHSIPNTAAAIFIATGQDVATLPECCQSQNLIEYDHDNRILHWEVHVPTLTVGTVGGGTSLPTQNECLEIMGCAGSGNVNKFAELCAVAALANDISFWGAVCANEWVNAHADLKTRTE